MLMDFWQELCSCCGCHVTDLVQEVPNFWLHEEVIGVQLLDGIGKGIQTDEVASIGSKVFDGLLDKVHGHLLGHIQVNLLFPKGIPEVLLAAIGKDDFLHRCLVLAFVNQVHIFLCWAVFWPEFLPAQEKVCVSGLVLLLLKILVVFGLAGDMVNHEVKHEVVFFPQALDIIPVTKSRVYFIVIHRGKTAVPSRWEKGQKMDTADGIPKVFGQVFIQLLEVLTQTV